jgi:hypothetical protein
MSTNTYNIAVKSLKNNITTGVVYPRTIKTLTAYNGAKVSTAQSKIGGSSGFFDGANDYIGLGNFSDLVQATASTPLTIEAYIYQTGNGGTIFNETYTGTGNAVTIALATASTIYNTGGGRKPWFGYYSGTSWVGIIGTTDLNLNTWYHIAGVYDGSTSKLYVDGVQVASGGPSTWTTATPNAFYIGRRWDDSAAVYYSGYIDELRLSNVARYTANFTPSTIAFKNDKNTKLLVHFDGIDGSTTFTDDGAWV